jgi:4-hydroxythreonine-4-phosphate dehydrogenase
VRALPRIAISLGDPSGIGPEVTAEAVRALRAELSPLVYGDPILFERHFRGSRLPVVGGGEPLPAGGALVAVTHLPASAARPGKPAPVAGAAQLAFLEDAFAAVVRGDAAALCTAPVSKAQVARFEEGFMGHTEWLEARTGAPRSVMMFDGARARVALVTTHVPFAELGRLLSPALVAETIRIVHRAMRDDFGIARPRVALAALNPHAGEDGLLGDEEARLLLPAMKLAARAGAPALGPFPADSVFNRAALGQFDVVVALYHDQGMIPVKLLDTVGLQAAVNVTLGLPIVRTSPDHGVAYDIAGKGKAKAESMIAALRLAAKIAARRAKLKRKAR